MVTTDSLTNALSNYLTVGYHHWHPMDTCSPK